MIVHRQDPARHCQTPFKNQADRNRLSVTQTIP